MSIASQKRAFLLEQLIIKSGLIPLVSSRVDSFNFTGDCSCSKMSVDEDEDSVCPVCCVKFEIRVKNTEDEKLLVTSNDIRPVKAKSEHQKSVVPAEYELMVKNEIQKRSIPIVKLGKNQEIWIECMAKKGIGQDHAKWSPVCVCVLRYEPEITLNETQAIQLNEIQKQEIINVCPKKVFTLDERNKQIVSSKPQDCIYCFECLKKTEEMGAGDFIQIEEGDFIFEIESNGSLRPDEIGK